MSGTARPSPFTEYRTRLIAALTVTIGILGWAVVNLLSEWARFATIIPLGYRGGSEVAISLARLFAALVLLLIVADGMGPRMRWMSCGFVVLGLGQLAFGYVLPIREAGGDLNDSLYQMVFVRALAAALFVVGLVPRHAPAFTWRTSALVLAISSASVVGYWAADRATMMPPLVQIADLEEAARLRLAPLTWTTGWHWLFATLPFALAIVAAFGAVVRNLRGEIGGWLPLSIILLAGSELHDALWPSAYGTTMLLTTADVLRLMMAAVVVIGGALELKRIAGERSALLASERERTQRLEGIARLKADFTAMVAHELGYPLSAIRRQTELLSRDSIDPDLRQRTLAHIIRETDALDTLVADVQESAVVEREDFRVSPRPVELGTLVRDARVVADAHDSDTSLDVELQGVALHDQVRADRERIGQVLQNLLGNATKYSQPGARILLRAVADGDRRVRFEVVDDGAGIEPDEIERIFGKFVRGGSQPHANVPGAGLGLYLSRRLVRAHGSDITVRSTPGIGSVFAFELERVRDPAALPAR